MKTKEITTQRGTCHDCSQGAGHMDRGFSLYMDGDTPSHWYCLYCGSKSVTILDDNGNALYDEGEFVYQQVETPRPATIDSGMDYIGDIIDSRTIREVTAEVWNAVWKILDECHDINGDEAGRIAQAAADMTEAVMGRKGQRDLSR